MDFTGDYSRRDLTRFLIPLIAAELFQQLYSLINSIVVEQVLDYRAVAVIGACSAFLSIRDNLISGMMYGFGIYLGRAVGSGDGQYFTRAFSGAFWYALLLGLLGLLVLPFTQVLLAAGNIPAEISRDSALYLAVSFGGCICISLKLLLLVTLQAIGDTKVTSFLAAAGVVINTALVILFVGVCHGGVAFSSLATILTNLAIALCLYIYIHRRYPERLRLMSPLMVPGTIWRDLIHNGAAKTVYFLLGSTGKLVLQRAVNTFSVETIAGQSWAVTLQTVLLAPLGELGTASGVITGQNAGAGNRENIRLYHRKLCTLMLVIGGAEIFLIYLAGTPLLQALCGQDAAFEVVSAANQWIRVTVLAMPVSFMILYRNALQALGCYAQVVLLGGVELLVICLTEGLLVPVYGYPAAPAGIAFSWIAAALVGRCFWGHAMKRGVDVTSSQGR